jgi:hypothetical protein
MDGNKERTRVGISGAEIKDGLKSCLDKTAAVRRTSIIDTSATRV